ncbi:MAG: hypothetical protein HY841_06080 [Bacteroidetes bacterium]|nr:hypothetical protein [Bacteroidota bacterium]
MNVVLCFEVSAKQDQVRQELASKGYMSNWKVKRGSRDEITYHLPSNLLWKKGKDMSPTKAKEELKKAANALNVKVTRAVALVVSRWDGMTGTPVGSGTLAIETSEA